MEKTIKNKHSYDGITLLFLKFVEREKSSNTEESSKYEDEDSIEVVWEGELVSVLEYLKKYGKINKVIKEQLEKVEEQVKQIKDMNEALEKQMNVREEELFFTKYKIKDLEEKNSTLENSWKET